MKRIILSLLLVSSSCFGSDLYPSNFGRSWSGIASWSQPRIASGTSLPPVASASVGDLFIDYSIATSPTLYRLEGNINPNNWFPLAGGAGTGSTSVLITVANPQQDDILLWITALEALLMACKHGSKLAGIVFLGRHRMMGICSQ